MKGGSNTNTEERLEEMGRRLERAERSNRAIKIWGSIAFAALISFGSGPFASTVLAKKKPPALLEAQLIELVSSSGQVLAALGTDSDGTGLTVFDSSGKKTLTLGNTADGTFTGLATWDGNSIFPSSTGVVRTAFGEANSSNVTGGGLGFAVYDTASKVRASAGTTPDVKVGFFETIDPNGSTTGIVDDGKTFFDQGFFANDLNGKNRTFVGNSLDGTTFNVAETVDPNGSTAGIIDDDKTFLDQGFFANDLNGKTRIFVGNSLDGTTFNEAVLFNSAGQLRTGLFNTATNGDGFDTFGANGNARIALFTSTDDSVSGYDVFDGTSLFGTQRLFAGLTPSGSGVETFDASHTLTGHLP